MVPALFNLLLQSSILQWRKAFFICLGISVFGSCIALAFTAGEEEPWAKVKNDEPTPRSDRVHKKRKKHSRIRGSPLRGSRKPEKER